MCARYAYDIGRIVIRNDECFWILPTSYNTCQDIYLVHSPYFTYLREKWRLVLEPAGCNGMMRLWLWREFYFDLPDCKYAVQFKLETRDGRRIGFREGVLTDYGFEAGDFCSRNNISSIAQHSGRFKILFSIIVKNDPADILLPGTVKAKSDEAVSKDENSSEDEITNDEEDSEKRKVSSKMKGLEILSKNLKQAFIEGQMTDAVLKVDSRKFGVHKIILAARSPVFASMFQHDLAEKKTNMVDIPDCTAQSFEVFLHYIYSGSAETLSVSSVYDVYYAADKYRVEDLKNKCVKFMKKNISEETVCDVIALSLRHEESKLLKFATIFFCQNMKKIVKTVQWQKYMDENSTQANELIIKALNA